MPQATPEADLESARNAAEARLTAFAEHTTDKDARADALFRLAALISERERERPSPDLPQRLARPIRIQRQIVRDAPGYAHLFDVEYQLAHDLSDAGRIAEAMQIFRSLVCRDTYAYPVPADAADPERDAIVPMVQDHPAAFWESWARAHPTPMSVAKPSANPSAEERFRNPYLGTCTPAPGSGTHDLAEIWLRIGNADFDMLMPEAGPYARNRAAAAFEHGLAAGASAAPSKAHAVVETALRYKLAWTYFKQQRYSAAASAFVAVLRMNAGHDFDDEARTYLAGSLTQVDFLGPAPDEPFIPRPDVLDTERDPRIAQQKMAVGLQRVDSPRIVPQGEPWTPSVYAALGREYRELNQLDNAIGAYDRLVAKWPASEIALAARYEGADCWARIGTLEPARKADARAKALAAYDAVVKEGSPGGAWHSANASNARALEAARAYVSSATTKARAL